MANARTQVKNKKKSNGKYIGRIVVAIISIKHIISGIDSANKAHGERKSKKHTGKTTVMAQRDYQTLPDDKTAKLARASAAELSQMLDRFPVSKQSQIKIEIDGQDLILPVQALVLLRNLLDELARGNAVTIVPLHAELTTQQAADILNVSRPYLINLLERGELPFTKVGTHRRIEFKALMAYKNIVKKRSSSAMDELVQIAQETNLGY